MQPFTIRYHRRGARYSPSAFYIAARGINTGWPSFEPIMSNCFVLECAPQDTTHYFWVVYALWHHDRFKPVLVGASTKFIRVKVLARMIARAMRKMDLSTRLLHLQSMQQREAKLFKELNLLAEYKKTTLAGLAVQNTRPAAAIAHP